ncbi:MAG: hypothetical protein EOO61_03025 [Hymenobacter sp.]|nr:MAG: hypothetical protein EOO61_03025 [Hymenobacter sp.]
MRLTSPIVILIGILIILNSCKSSVKQPEEKYMGWNTYAGSKDGSRYSANEKITPQNVASLKVAWTYSSQDKDTPPETATRNKDPSH